MKLIGTLSVLLCISGQILAREDRLSEDCLNGIADRDMCCAGVPDAWYAHLRNPQDCGSFYQCEHEKATWKACPAGLHWSVVADRCEWPDIAGCEATATQEPSTEAPTTPTKIPSTTSAPPTTSGGDNPQLPKGCYDGSIDAVTCCEGITAWYIHLPDPNNCGKFFHCDNGKAVHKDCPAGLHWSVKEDKCDWPEAAGCQGTSTTQQPTTQKPTTQQPTTQKPTTQGPTTSRPVTQQPTTTPQEPSTEKPTTQRPTTEQPTTTAVPSTEPTTTPQKPSTTAIPPTSAAPPSTTAAPLSTTAAPPTTSAPPTEDQCAPEPVCHQCLSGVFPADLCCRDVETYHKLHLASGSDCSSYYTCVDGHAVAHQCPEGLHWSIDSDRCEWPADAKCEANNGGNGNEGGNNGGETGNGEVSDDCLNGKVDAKTCCQHVPYWIDVLLQNNADCHTFFQCVHGAPMVRPCPAGLWWSVTANRCEWKENATCTW